MSQLSKNFTLEELTRTKTGLPNIPSAKEVAALTELCSLLLQPIRDKWGPMQIDSGFRCDAVNKAVGGSATSQHRFGGAADIVPVDADIDEVFEWIVKKSGLKFGQAILELKKGVRWIHISLPTNTHQGQALKYDGIGYSTYA